MAKLTTLEGDFDFYGSAQKANPYLADPYLDGFAIGRSFRKTHTFRAPRVSHRAVNSFLGADEVALLGFSFGKALRKTGNVASSGLKAVVSAPVSVAKAVVAAPVSIARAVGVPTTAIKAVTFLPAQAIKAAEVVNRNLVVKPMETLLKVPEIAYNKVISPVADIAMRNPITTAVATGGLSLIPQMVTEQGRSNLLGKKSTVQKIGGMALRNPLTTAALTGGWSLLPTMFTATGQKNLFGRASAIQQAGHFIERHPYMTAPITGGLGIAADLFTKRGRQALTGKTPGVRSSPGLTGADRDEFITLRNKSNPTPADLQRIKDLQTKGDAKLAQDKSDADKKAADAATVANAASGGASSGTNSGGGGGGSSPSSDEAPADAPASSPMGGILLAAGLGALMLL